MFTDSKPAYKTTKNWSKPVDHQGKVISPANCSFRDETWLQHDYNAARSVIYLRSVALCLSCGIHPPFIGENNGLISSRLSCLCTIVNVSYSMGWIAGEDSVSFHSKRGFLLEHVMRHLEIMHLLQEIALRAHLRALPLSKIVFIYLRNIAKLMYPCSKLNITASYST